MQVLALDIAAGRPNPSSAHAWDGGARRVEARCDNCGTGYTDYKNRHERAKRHYCSAVCQRADRRGDRNPKWRGGKLKRVCRNCNAEFFRCFGATAKGRSVYCSFACKVAHQRKYPDAATRCREVRRVREIRKKAGQAIRTHTYGEWQQLLGRYKHRCANCRCKRKLERDHIVPLSRGGHDGIENIQPLCKSCNCKKWRNLWLLC